MNVKDMKISESGINPQKFVIVGTLGVVANVVALSHCGHDHNYTVHQSGIVGVIGHSGMLMSNSAYECLVKEGLIPDAR